MPKVKPLVLGATLLVAATGAGAQVVRDNSVTATSGSPAYFTGRVSVSLLTKATPPGQAGLALVTFSPGARTRWHTHPAGQIFYVTQGCGWTQEEGGPVLRVCKGDTVYVKPGVRHWHGGTATTSMSHLAVTETLGGKNVDWSDAVSDVQFKGPER